MPEQKRDGDLNSLEAALKVLIPASNLNRDRLMFEAGRATTRKRRWVWPSLTAAALLLSGMLSAILVMRPTVERPIYVQIQPPAPAPMPAPLATEPAQPLARADYLRLRDQLLTDGVESLPPSSPAPVSPPLRLKDLLEPAADNLDRPGSSEF